jgi:lipoprotein-anchoring transpeptidase ErfK/SrfK
MQRRVATANRKRASNKMLQAALIGLALTLSATAVYAQNSPKPAAVSKPHSARRVVVSIPDRKLALMEENRVVKIYDVAVGAPASPSPSGEFQITERLENPTYYSPGVVIEPGAGNPLGTRWMGLDIKGFGIHGTNSPDSIGYNASHGCIRLRNGEVEELFVRLKVGDRVSVIAERTDEVAQIFGPAPGSSSTHTQAASNAVRFPPADEPGSER